MWNEQKHFKEKHSLTALLNRCHCYSSPKSEEFYSAGFHLDLSKMDNKSNVQYKNCDQEENVTSKSRIRQYDYRLRCQKSYSQNRTWTSKLGGRICGNMLIVAIISLILLDGKFIYSDSLSKLTLLLENTHTVFIH